MEMENENPLVSIIIPVYNGENYLNSAINSALSQNYKNCEIIVINDGSKDNTEKIALSYGDTIRYFAKENGGVSTALNMGIQNMKGEYFSWLSHDDIYYPHKIECQINALKDIGDMTRISWGDYDTLVEGSEIKENVMEGSVIERSVIKGSVIEGSVIEGSVIKRTAQVYSTNFSQYDHADLLCHSIFPVIKSYIAGCTLLIHKSHFERVGVFREDLRYTQDYELWFRMLRGQKTVYINRPLYVIRSHALQDSKKNISKVRPQEADLWLNITRSVSQEEADDLFGSLGDFYKYICDKMDAFGYPGVRDEVKKITPRL